MAMGKLKEGLYSNARLYYIVKPTAAEVKSTGTILLQLSTIEALKSLSDHPNKSTYDEIILKLIDIYRQDKKEEQWRHDHHG